MAEEHPTEKRLTSRSVLIKKRGDNPRNAADDNRKQNQDEKRLLHAGGDTLQARVKQVKTGECFILSRVFMPF